LYGNPGKRPLNDREPRPKPDLPTCPAHLDPEAKKEWRRVARSLHACGILTIVDRAVLAAYCQSYSRWVKLEGIVQRAGEVIFHPTTKTFYPNPYLGALNNALRNMHSFASELGMSPSARGRLHVTPVSPESDSLDEFLKEA
jgi:P27 family predicted phage terminase small subunit